jgi:hypothetical protein
MKKYQELIRNIPGHNNLKEYIETKAKWGDNKIDEVIQSHIPESAGPGT